MGWFPARDKFNRVPPENLNWPQKPTTISGENIIKGKRAHQTMKGTRVKPIPAVGTPPARIKKSWAKLAVENARALGFYNGHRIKSAAERAVTNLDKNRKS